MAIQPLSWIAAASILAALFVWSDRRAAAFCTAAFPAILLILIGFSPLPFWSIHRLERLTPFVESINEQEAATLAGVIVLGGMVELTNASDPTPALSDAADRFITGLVVAKQLPPDRTLVFTGASRSFERAYVPEAQRLADLAKTLGYDGKIWVETQASNTCEHGPELTRLIGPTAAKQRWVLVTSAYHMPRSIACFAKAGWVNILPYPTDYLSERSDHRLTNAGWMMRLVVFNRSIRERVGLVIYRLVGRID